MGANSILKYAALFSCKKNVEVALEEYTPLSKTASDLSANAQWAYELESDRLDKKINSFEAIDKSIPLIPVSIVVLEGGSPMASVYPELEGFGSLDTSSIRGELFDTIKDFCLSLVEYSKNLEDVEKHGLPVQEEEKEKENEGESKAESSRGSSKIDSFFSSRSIFSLALFLNDSKQAGVLESFVIGRPLVGEESMEVPVLWHGKKQKLYSKLYPIQEEQGWKIQQIEIYKTEENNGSGETDRN